MKKYIKDIFYSADSRGEFRYGSPLESESFLSGKSIQLLTHPVWWMTNASQKIAKLQEMRKKHFDEFDLLLSENNVLYRTQMTQQEGDH